MRTRHLPLLFLPLVLACGSTPSHSPTKTAPDAPVPLSREALLREAAAIFERTGSLEAEAILAAAGEEAVPLVRPLLGAEDPQIRWRTLGLLLDAGEPLDLDTEEQVDLILFDLTRHEVWAYASLRALARLKALGDEARPRLREVAAGSDDQATAARQLLARFWEEP
jgi:hypothetical protein